MDLTLSCTVLEEGDADRMLAEMIRVTKPGGRVAVIVRAIDDLLVAGYHIIRRRLGIAPSPGTQSPANDALDSV